MHISRFSLATLCLVALFAAPAFAQQENPTGGGIELGANLSYLTVTDASDRSAGLGGVVGAFYIVP
jgi:hypothetical protein